MVTSSDDGLESADVYVARGHQDGVVSTSRALTQAFCSSPFVLLLAAVISSTLSLDASYSKLERAAGRLSVHATPVTPLAELYTQVDDASG